ncbi:MAG TPA: DUF4428 domain-containing protein [Clostridia bacterium]|nr:DUF4428 domain-containing protein [Clostridia bacterium]
MGLFDKKFCDICGGKIGLLGNRKLDDGNLCKDCAAKLSPFFSERRRSTVADIKEQLEYREANLDKVAAFKVTRTLGVGTKVLMDEDNKNFIVSSNRRWQEANPDVLSFSQVTGCNVDIEEQRNELKQRDKDGNERSYNPPRFEHEYNFYIIIHVNHPYFSEIRFKLNNLPIKIMPPAGRVMMPSSAEIGRMSVDYREYAAMAEEIKSALTQVRQEERESIAAVSAPKTASICPHCGATTIADSQGCCEFCGGAMGVF